jgi:DNA-binding transcriptional regulator YbjK
MPNDADAERRDAERRRYCLALAPSGALASSGIGVVWHWRRLALASSGIGVVWHWRCLALALSGIGAVWHWRCLALADIPVERRKP